MAAYKRYTVFPVIFQCFSLNGEFYHTQSHELNRSGSLARSPPLCVCVITGESSRGCARLSITIAINSNDSELIADPRPQALQRYCNRLAAGRDESDKGIPHSLICIERRGGCITVWSTKTRVPHWKTVPMSAWAQSKFKTVNVHWCECIEDDYYYSW